MILSRMKISLHSHSLITGIFQTPSTPESGCSSETQSRGWWRVRDSHLPGCQETWLCSQWFLKPPPNPTPNPASLHRAVWTPPRRNLLCLKLYRYSKVKGSAKNNFPRQSEQIILMRAWKWETNDTKLASLPFVNCAGEGTKPPSESAVGELKAASGFRKFLSEAPHLPFPEMLFLLRSLFTLFQGSQGPSLLVHKCFKFPLGSLKEKRIPECTCNSGKDNSQNQGTHISQTLPLDQGTSG